MCELSISSMLCNMWYGQRRNTEVRGQGKVVILSSMVRTGFSAKVTFEQKWGRKGRMSEGTASVKAQWQE